MQIDMAAVAKLAEHNTRLMTENKRMANELWRLQTLNSEVTVDFDVMVDPTRVEEINVKTVTRLLLTELMNRDMVYFTHNIEKSESGFRSVLTTRATIKVEKPQEELYREGT